MSQKPAHAPLLPPGRHVMTIDQLKSVCVDAFPGSKQRPLLFNELVRLIADLNAIDFVGELWIDGSFTTEKPEPRDIDLTVSMFEFELDSIVGDAYYFLFEDLNGDGTYSEYLDCFLSLKYLREDDRRDADTSDYWSEIWGVGWDGRLTGFIVIKLGESDVGLRLLA